VTIVRRLRILLLAALAACGGGSDGGGGSDDDGRLRFGTVAYVNTECREENGVFTARQTLRLLNDDGSEAVVARDAAGPMPAVGLCRLLGLSRSGRASVVGGSFQRIGVVPDGSGVIFEITRAYSILGLPRLPEEQEGFFFVRTDGSGLRRLAPPSRDPSFRLAADPGAPTGFRTTFTAPLPFSPDGRRFLYTDLGPGASGQDGMQLFGIDVISGERRQITRLDPVELTDPLARQILSPRFLDDDTVLFSAVVPPDPSYRAYTIRTDGSSLKRVIAPLPVPDGEIDPSFQITGDRPASLRIFGQIFVFDGSNLLQLTGPETGFVDPAQPLLDANGGRVFFVGTSNVLGTNPAENCQVFSVSVLADRLRQLTRFGGPEHSPNGCNAPDVEPGCNIDTLRQNPETGVLIYESSCNPLGGNPFGNQVFAMRPDGSGLAQLTRAGGFRTAGGATEVELPGPFAATAVRH